MHKICSIRFIDQTSLTYIRLSLHRKHYLQIDRKQYISNFRADAIVPQNNFRYSLATKDKLNYSLTYSILLKNI